jgi:hypothetical protein
MTRRTLCAIAIGVTLTGCSGPPSYLAATLVPTPRNATEVNASFVTTWFAAVDVFAESNVPIATADQSSGVLVPAAGKFLGGRADSTYADCGQVFRYSYERRAMAYQPVVPRSARYNVRIKGDAARSTVQVNAIYIAGDTSCVTRAKWEVQFEQAIKLRSERSRD